MSTVHTQYAFVSDRHKRFFVDNTAEAKWKIQARFQREGTQERIELTLALKFSTKSRIGGAEFVIGSSESTDHKLGSQREGLSARHMLIGFDENNIIVKGISLCGSSIR